MANTTNFWFLIILSGFGWQVSDKLFKYRSVLIIVHDVSSTYMYMTTKRIILNVVYVVCLFSKIIVVYIHISITDIDYMNKINLSSWRTLTGLKFRVEDKKCIWIIEFVQFKKTYAQLELLLVLVTSQRHGSYTFFQINFYTASRCQPTPITTVYNLNFLLFRVTYIWIMIN